MLVAATGMTLVILARQIDISVGSQASVCAVVAGLLARAGLPMPMVGAGTLLAGAGLGAVNGWLVAGLGLPSIVVTLAMLVILRESLRYLREGESVRDLPADFQWFGLGQGAGQWVVVGIALGVFAAFAWGMRYLSAGRAVYATGSDPEAARLAGIRPKRVVFSVFVAMGALTGMYRPAQRRAVSCGRPQDRHWAGDAGDRGRGGRRRGGLGRPRDFDRHLDRRTTAGDDQPGARLPAYECRVGEGDPGGHHPPGRRVGRPDPGRQVTWR